MIIVSILVLVLALPIALFIYFRSKMPAERLLEIGTKAPALEFITLHGAVFDLAPLKGKIILLLFFKTDCDYCLQELDYLDRLNERFKNGLQILAVSESDSKSTTDFVNNSKLSLPILLDYKRIFRNKFRGNFVPTLYLLDDNMVILYGRIGLHDFGEVERIISQLVGLGIEEEEGHQNDTANSPVSALDRRRAIAFQSLDAGILIRDNFVELNTAIEPSFF